MYLLKSNCCLVPAARLLIPLHYLHLYGKTMKTVHCYKLTSSTKAHNSCSCSPPCLSWIIPGLEWLRCAEQMEVWQITKAGKEYFCLSLGRDRLVESPPAYQYQHLANIFTWNCRKNSRVAGFALQFPMDCSNFREFRFVLKK